MLITLLGSIFHPSIPPTGKSSVAEKQALYTGVVVGGRQSTASPPPSRSPRPLIRSAPICPRSRGSGRRRWSRDPSCLEGLTVFFSFFWRRARFLVLGGSNRGESLFMHSTRFRVEGDTQSRRRLTEASDLITMVMAGRTGASTGGGGGASSRQRRNPAPVRPNDAKRRLQQQQQQQQQEADFNDRKVIASTYFSIGAFLVLACLAVSLLVLPLVLPPLPPPPSLLLWLPVCLLFLLIVLAFMPMDVRSMTSSCL